MDNAKTYFLVVLLFAIILDFFIVWKLRPNWLIKGGKSVNTLKNSVSNWRSIKTSEWRVNNKYEKRTIFLELGILALWAIWVGRAYLDFDPNVIPAGGEFLSAIQTHHLWMQFQQCGWCAVWNGFERGGHPAFVDIHGSMLHPVVVLTTLVFGVLSGAKVTLVISLWVAGLAQWWLARVMKLGQIPRVWSGAMAIVGGHLAGRMELGAFGVVLSTAMCSLFFAAAIAVAKGGGRRAVVILAVVSASAALSGQGYIQVGLVGVLPALLFLFFDDEKKWTPLWKDYLLAFGLALLLAAVFLVPLIHFSPNFVKHTDPDFKSAQPLSYLPLNLLIDDWEYHQSDVMAKLPYPHLYALYIGWVPVALAIFGLAKGKNRDKHLLWFFTTGILLEFLIGSAVLLKWVATILPSVAGVRHPPQIAGLAVPLILGLSAYGLEALWNADWPTLSISSPEGAIFPKSVFSSRWLLIFFLILGLRSGYKFTQHWLRTEEANQIAPLLKALKTESLAWVEPPFGEHYFIEPAIGLGLKLSPGVMTWRWKDREFPVAEVAAIRSDSPPEQGKLVTVVDDINIYKRNDQPYANVSNNEEPCNAYGSGGSINVFCTTTSLGELTVKENMWTGWQAWIDGERAPLIGEFWLKVDAPLGKHVYQFRYRPWDVPLGIFLSLVGVFLCVQMWFKVDPAENAKQS